MLLNKKQAETLADALAVLSAIDAHVPVIRVTEDVHLRCSIGQAICVSQQYDKWHFNDEFYSGLEQFKDAYGIV